MRCLLLAAIWALPCIACADTPDFSGQWQRADANDVGSGWGDGSGSADLITLAQDAARLRAEYAFFARTDMQPPLVFVYDLEGGETTNSVMMGRGEQKQVSRAKWVGNQLSITTVHELTDRGKPVKSEVRQVLTLQSPTELIIETTRGAMLGGPSTSSRSVYRRVESGQ